jgi:hypothetical protein
MICLATIRHCSLKQPRQTSLRRRGWEGHYCPVRWKLLIITSFVAALINAGGAQTLAYWMMGGATPLRAPTPGVVAGVTIIPLIFTTLACIFVYRHTARRRKLQAALTALFTLVLTFAALVASRMFLSF